MCHQLTRHISHIIIIIIIISIIKQVMRIQNYNHFKTNDYCLTGANKLIRQHLKLTIVGCHKLNHNYHEAIK